jgi:hypothetical protein
MRAACLCALLLVTLPAAAETLPEAPKPHLDRADWALLASDAGARALDTYSTRWSLCRGNHEMFLPGFVANHTAALAAFEGGMVTVDYYAARNLTRRHHPRLARFVLAADGLQVWPWAIHNLTIPRCSHH